MKIETQKKKKENKKEQKMRKKYYGISQGHIFHGLLSICVFNKITQWTRATKGGKKEEKSNKTEIEDILSFLLLIFQK